MNQIVEVMTGMHVVCDEHTFGYLHHENDMIDIFRALVRKGATWEYLPEPKMKSQFKVVRKATLQDFKDFRISEYENRNKRTSRGIEL